MTKPLRILGVSVLALSIALFVLSIVFRITGIYINTTPSLPVGLYRIVAEPIAKGAYVAFCPPRTEIFDRAIEQQVINTGDCPGGYGQLLKRVFAASNDWVQIDLEGIRINGELLPNTAQVLTDSAVVTLQSYRLDAVLNESEYLLLADLHPRSLDARYFGLTHRTQILHVVRPLLTWNSNSRR